MGLQNCQEHREWSRVVEVEHVIQSQCGRQRTEYPVLLLDVAVHRVADHEEGLQVVVNEGNDMRFLLRIGGQHTVYINIRDILYVSITQ